MAHRVVYSMLLSHNVWSGLKIIRSFAAKSFRLSSRLRCPQNIRHGCSKVGCVAGGLAGTRHTSVSSDMTSSGLRLSRQQFFPLIHSCNEINRANSKSRECNPWIWQLRCGPRLVQEIWRDRVWAACVFCGLDTIGTVFTDDVEKTLEMVRAKRLRLPGIGARTRWSACRVTCYVTT